MLNLSNIKFIDSLHPYTEIAVNGNSIDHKQLVWFLKDLKKRRIIANITVNQIHFERKEKLIRQLIDDKLINGIGISLRKPTREFINRRLNYKI